MDPTTTNTDPSATSTGPATSTTAPTTTAAAPATTTAVLSTTAAASTTTTTSGTSNGTIQFSLWDDTSSSTKGLFFIKTDIGNLKSQNLAQLRRILASSPQEQDCTTYFFCTENGSTVPDSWNFNDYLEAIKDSAAKSSTKADTQSTDSTSTTKPSSTADALLGSNLYSVYLKKPSSFESSAAKKYADIDTTLPKGAAGKLLTAPELKEIMSKYVAADFTAQAGTVVTHAADLREMQWGIIAQNNGLFNGLTVIRQTDSKTSKVYAIGLGNSRRQAFQFKKREIHSYMLSPSNINDTKMSLRIPVFIVDDQSYVSVFETTNAFQSSLAYSSCSEADIKLAVEGGAFGVKVGVSSGFSYVGSDASTKADMGTGSKMNISYNFPRVTIMLDEECLELTDQCQKDLATIVDMTTLTTFLNRYGEFFATRVQLGGRLFASDDSSTFSEATVADKAMALKAAAAVTFSATLGVGTVGGSASISGGTANQSNTSSTNSNSSRKLMWDATGGDTLLANNPPAWCPTVASFYNWRITKQDLVVPLMDIISRMPGYSANISNLMNALNSANNISAPSGSTSASVQPIATPDEIFLQLTSFSAAKLYLTAYDPSLLSLGVEMVAWYVDGRNVNDVDPGPVLSFVRYYSIGACFCAPAVSESNLSGQRFQVLNLDKSPVKTAQYETRYILYNSSSLFYVTPMRYENGVYLSASLSPGSIVFHNPTGSRSPDEINSGSSVVIGVFEGTSPNSPELGSLLYGKKTADSIPTGIVTGGTAAQWSLTRLGRR